MSIMEEREAKQRREADRIEDAYFDWMIRLVCDGKRSWRKLFRLLHETEFIYILGMDANRADDGVDLRYRFGYEIGLDADSIRRAIDNRPCSILEMMVALAHRCEEHITDDPDNGDRTGQWFFEMIQSLGLMDMDDRRFDKIVAADVLAHFMRREYRPDGRGGLFTIQCSGHDMRRDEIWYQMMWYLNESVYGKEVSR